VGVAVSASGIVSSGDVGATVLTSDE
jgi:hypothetical protein